MINSFQISFFPKYTFPTVCFQRVFFQHCIDDVLNKMLLMFLVFRVLELIIGIFGSILSVFSSIRSNICLKCFSSVYQMNSSRNWHFLFIFFLLMIKSFGRYGKIPLQETFTTTSTSSNFLPKHCRYNRRTFPEVNVTLREEDEQNDGF